MSIALTKLAREGVGYCSSTPGLVVVCGKTHIAGGPLSIVLAINTGRVYLRSTESGVAITGTPGEQRSKTRTDTYAFKSRRAGLG